MDRAEALDLWRKVAAWSVMFLVLFLLLRELPRRLGFVAQGIAVVLIGFEAVGFAMALRA